MSALKEAVRRVAAEEGDPEAMVLFAKLEALEMSVDEAMMSGRGFGGEEEEDVEEEEEEDEEEENKEEEEGEGEVEEEEGGEEEEENREEDREEERKRKNENENENGERKEKKDSLIVQNNQQHKNNDDLDNNNNNMTMIVQPTQGNANPNPVVRPLQPPKSASLKSRSNDSEAIQPPPTTAYASMEDLEDMVKMVMATVKVGIGAAVAGSKISAMRSAEAAEAAEAAAVAAAMAATERELKLLRRRQKYRPQRRSWKEESEGGMRRAGELEDRGDEEN